MLRSIKTLYTFVFFIHCVYKGLIYDSFVSYTVNITIENSLLPVVSRKRIRSLIQAIDTRSRQAARIARQAATASRQAARIARQAARNGSVVNVYIRGRY